MLRLMKRNLLHENILSKQSTRRIHFGIMARFQIQEQRKINEITSYEYKIAFANFNKIGAFIEACRSYPFNIVRAETWKMGQDGTGAILCQPSYKR